MLFPALVTSGAPFVRIVSCSPLEVPRSRCAAAVLGAAQRRSRRSGTPTAPSSTAPIAPCGPTSTPGFRPRAPTRCPSWSSCPRRATPPTSTSTRPRPTISTPGRSTTAGPGWTPACARPTSDYALPAEVADRPDDSALIYLSLGSLGGADVELMQRLVDVLGTTRHRFIVSKGPQADQITLPDNMVGAQMLPQTKVIPQVDLVISHGGNNTMTETLHFGKPLIVLPLFWDQYENAQRIDELGFGVRLDTYALRRRRADRRRRTAARRHRAARPARPRSAPRSAAATGCGSAPTSSSGSVRSHRDRRLT